MDNMEKMLEGVLNDPATMEKIMAFAQSMGASSPPPAPPPEEKSPFEGIDISMLQKLSSLAGKSGIDNNQKALLHALRPYVGAHRLQKLERAMQAAKMAGLATGLMGNLF